MDEQKEATDDAAAGTSLSNVCFVIFFADISDTATPTSVVRYVAMAPRPWYSWQQRKRD